MGNRVQILTDDDYGKNVKVKIHKDAHGAKEMQVEVSQQLFNCCASL